MGFPLTRMRRLRSSETIRALVRETTLCSDDFILPLFVCPGNSVTQEIISMPNVFRMSIDRTVEECRKIEQEGVKAILLFGIPESKDDDGTIGSQENGIVQKAIRAIKKATPSLLVVTDVCNCEYTVHGHCGPIKNGTVDNDTTINLLAKQALSHAQAGADIVAPSDMMDGRVGQIRKSLDISGFQDIPIMSYSVKYASAFYGPFRDAAGSAPSFGDRKSYQMDPSNSKEAIREATLDIEEGADILMVKPALSYLDIIATIKSRFNIPLAAYNVSGEYAMVHAAANNGWIDRERVMMEILTSIKRAGSDIIITYHAREASKLLRQGWYK